MRAFDNIFSNYSKQAVKTQLDIYSEFSPNLLAYFPRIKQSERFEQFVKRVNVERVFSLLNGKYTLKQLEKAYDFYVALQTGVAPYSYQKELFRGFDLDLYNDVIKYFFGIAFDAFSGGAINSNSLTVSHTVGSLTNGFLIASVSANGSTGDQISGVTFNSVAMTRLAFHQATLNGVYTYLYGLLNPSSGTHNIVVSASNTFVIRAANGSYSGVQQSGQPDASAGAGQWTSAVTSITASPSVVSSSCWMVSAMQNDSGNAPTPGGVLTSSRGNDGANILILGDSNGVVGTGSQNATWTATSEKMDTIAASIIGIASLTQAILNINQAIHRASRW